METKKVKLRDVAGRGREGQTSHCSCHLVIGELELLHLAVHDRGALPVRRRLRDERLRPLQAVTRRLGVRVHCAACKTEETPMKSRARYSASEVR